jgi:transposase-like protein
MAKPRKFSPEFKAKIALAALRGEATAAELCRKHQLSDTVICRWKLQLVKSAHQIFASTTPDDACAASPNALPEQRCAAVRAPALNRPDLDPVLEAVPGAGPRCYPQVT